ncbi:DUF2254 domain-containing protein [Pseudoalteromonas lipolytica]|jgi:uncharacterized membrane protein|uniref:DUF2254 domain-containing protein n=1 Tax=Pseudoalteromonas lipolytica TaxID=570156 RepID=A0AAD0S0B3_9GAMM|nr:MULTISPECIES: DUF2254 domain-containing protein [Pseudoalteromonas]AXV65293.1 DUF2254 domain-containing protein [Pseudoalteromonas donghaensis]MBE0350898.1 hypothetical protein [Pseudoalteromonas lipolytica LMEB 39]QPL44344.1 DUF2254 domain-containing protein [Pseudoalteromonas sp. A41-2]SFT32326.1 Uncharacterized membrane protein [Pseudoalteromonas lipolytica]
MFTPRKIADNYREMISSIGFYPSMLSVLFLLFALITTAIEYAAITMEVKQFFAVLLVDSEENARTILSTLAGSIISLTVFSFSMVMVVLNSASASLSPRVLPGLITRKSHQLVLGFYLGSIIYTIIMLINIRAMENGEMGIPSLGIFFSLLFGLVSLGFFVYFIHSISKAIQVDNVLNDLFKNTKNELTCIVAMQKDTDVNEFPNFDEWHNIKSETEGYFKGAHSDKLCALCKEHDIKIYIAVKQGFFTVKGYPFLKCDKDLSDMPELVDALLNCFIFYIEEYISDHYRYGMTQISEIAVKAMSPGINDPGTAVKAIDMLSILLIERLKISDVNYSLKHSTNNQPYLYLHETSFDELLHDNFTPIRNYAKGDAYVMVNVLEAFKNILFRSADSSKATESLFVYLEAIVEDINKHITNEYDRQQVTNMLKAIARISEHKGKALVAKFTTN